ncbi:ABC transporter substrate-binding protein, partial [Chloroflexota bacterium]
PAKPGELTKLVVALDWFPWGRSIPYFVGVQKGYFAEENLELEFIPTYATSDREIGTKAADIGETSGSAGPFILQVAQGLPIKAICGEFQGADYGFMGRLDINPHIKSAQDMAGTTLALKPGINTDLGIAFLTKAGLLDKVEIVTMEGGAGVGAVLQGTIDAIFTLAGTEPYFDHVGGYWFVRSQDVGLDLFPTFMVAHNDLINNRPEVVKAFVRAYLKGFSDALADPEAGVDALVELNEEINRPQELRAFQFLAAGGLVTKNTEGKPLGWMSEKDWEASQNTLVQWSQTITITPRPLSDYFTNEFLP